MLFYILKSSACLAVFMLFYKFFLEKISAHHFKRFYLIAVILVATIIPFITFTQYVEATEHKEIINVTSLQETYTNNLSFRGIIPIFLWSIYGIGVLFFLMRFINNLHQLIKKIKANPKYRNLNSTNILVEDLIIPHTFFNFIFLNKTLFEKNKIPIEVLLHEQTHAKQKHTLDVLFIEILQIVFWFNPILYFIKKDIKLNHEFLADQAVLKQGITSSKYQNTLLAFSSNASYSSLANALHYSSIKKRFTVMKTQTPKTSILFRGLVILPLLGLLIYGFSEKVVTKECEKNTIVTQKSSSCNESYASSSVEFCNNAKSILNESSKSYFSKNVFNYLNNTLEKENHKDYNAFDAIEINKISKPINLDKSSKKKQPVCCEKTKKGVKVLNNNSKIDCAKSEASKMIVNVLNTTLEKKSVIYFNDQVVSKEKALDLLKTITINNKPKRTFALHISCDDLVENLNETTIKIQTEKS